MKLDRSSVTRRRFLEALAVGGVFYTVPGLFAQEVTRTPSQTEGPFYPNRLPLDTDNDLLIINNGMTPAVGDISHVGGRILGANGSPIRNALVEIWQCDNNGAYLHADSDNGNRRDRNFQGFGRFMTAANGEYYFRTIKPVAYPGRTPHIHYKIKIRGQQDFVTQVYIRGHEGNARDGILQGIRDQRQRESVQVEFTPVPRSRTGELQARFDITLGFTPEMP